jgi:hypothetical protein
MPLPGQLSAEINSKVILGDLCLCLPWRGSPSLLFSSQLFFASLQE